MKPRKSLRHKAGRLRTSFIPISCLFGGGPAADNSF